MDTVNRVVPRLIESGRYIRPTLGITANDDVSERLLEEMGVSGVLVLRVQSGSAAHKAGLRGTRVTTNGGIVAGDVILAIEGVPVARIGDLIDRLEGFNIGDRVELQIYRDGSRQTVFAVLGPGKSRATGSLSAPDISPRA